MKFLHNNGLTIALVVLFLVSIAGHLLAGWQVHLDILRQHGEPGMGLAAYAHSPAFLSSLFENWESEFLQMTAYVILTAYLFQRGSAESHDPDVEPRDSEVTIKGWGHWLYAHSLGLTLAALFAASFVLHLVYSREAADDAIRHGKPIPSLGEHLASSGFWFESFQNWQSEFFSTAALIVLSIKSADLCLAPTRLLLTGRTRWTIEDHIVRDSSPFRRRRWCTWLPGQGAVDRRSRNLEHVR